MLPHVEQFDRKNIAGPLEFLLRHAQRRRLFLLVPPLRRRRQCLQRLERAGWLDAEWRQTENSRRAKFYRLTRAGKKQLDLETTDWSRRASAIC